MKIGIVGLPNVGKSTLFNSITKAGAECANYPFCTIEPNVGMVTVPDSRIDKLAEIYHPQKTTYATIEFVDIAGLVKGASKGEGLGNKFLSHIREVDSIAHVVRCFEDNNIVHVDGSVDPIRDIETINMELCLADLETAEKRLETIKEFNELGSGFKIAMRDLSIRGAGDILGEEQSGFIESIGVDMYLKLLDEEINKKENHDEPKKLDPSLATPKVSRTIKSSYIDNDDARIYVHKRIDKLNNLFEANELLDELNDRFGKVEEDLLLYIYEKLMNNFCNELGIYKIEDGRGFTTFIFNQEKSANLNGEKLFMLTNQYKNINLTQMNREVRVVLDIRGLEKLEQFKMICSYFNDYIS